MNNIVLGVVWSLAPTIILAGIFWFILRGIVRADRTERKIFARMEAEERARRGLTPKPPVS